MNPQTHQRPEKDQFYLSKEEVQEQAVSESTKHDTNLQDDLDTQSSKDSLCSVGHPFGLSGQENLADFFVCVNQDYEKKAALPCLGKWVSHIRCVLPVHIVAHVLSTVIAKDTL